MNEEKKVILKTVSIDLRAHKDIAKIIREAMKIFKTDKKSKAVIFALQEWYALRKKYPILVDLYKELTKEVRELRKVVEKLTKEVNELKILYLRNQKNK